MPTLGETTFVLIDTETGGLDPEACDLLEVCAVRVELDGNASFIMETKVRPTRPIPPEASAIHHLVAEDFIDAPSAEWVKAQLALVIPSNAVIVAHHAEFDRGFVAPALADRRWLCSKRLANHLIKDAPSYSNAVLWYFLGGSKIRFSLHGARADLALTASLMGKLIERYRDAGLPNDIDALLSLAESPFIMSKPTGNYLRAEFRTSWDALLAEPGYVRWMLAKDDLDDDLRWNIERQQRLRHERLAGVRA